MGACEARGAILADWRSYAIKVLVPQFSAWLCKLVAIGVFLAAYGIPATFQTMSVAGGTSLANVVSVTPGRASVNQAVSSGANLTNANLEGTDLSGANLSEANLGGAQIVDTDLSDADLTGSNLQDATITGTNLDGATLCGTIRTDGTTDDTSCPASTDTTDTETTDTEKTETTTETSEATVTSFMVGELSCPSGGGDGDVAVSWTTNAATAARIEVDGETAEDAGPSGTATVAVPCDGEDHAVSLTALGDEGEGETESRTVSSG